MVKLIEDQMYEVAKKKEEERRRKLQEEWKRDPKKKDRKVPKKTVYKPWTRGVFPRLCQDTEWIATVSEYDYALSDAEFQDYCRTRGVLHVAGTPGSTHRKFCDKHQLGPEDYFRVVGRKPPQPTHPDGEAPPPEADTDWLIIRIARGRLQDCWELYLSNR